jgi:uncharacterized repeat protein (TIGR01451 family)
MRRRLALAPLEEARPAPDAQGIVSLPMPDGSEQRFRIMESSVMAPELAAKYPEIKTYVGQGIDDPAASVRLDMTPAGFHAQILSPHGAVYIDPHFRDASVYASYYKRDYRRAADAFQCVTVADETTGLRAAATTDLNRSGGSLRTYRLACAADGEYTAFHGGTVSAGLAAVVTAINRINGIYEAELAIRLVLVANNDLIIYTNASTDPYSNTSGSTMLNQNQTTLDSIIGSANYDIGHVFSTGGGGIAGLGVVCVTGSKARGVTGNTSPTGDSFWVDYVAHEMGHQFGGNHTFNSTTGNCGGGNRNAPTAYEQGSGSTIMAYAGICGTDDLQPHSDPYFHAASFDEIVAYSTSGSGNGCAVVTATGNTAPTVSAGANYSIPQNTPFTLTATGSDPNGDPLTYCWEERDLGASTTVTAADNGSSPLFRSWNPTVSPSRTFPRLQDLLNNTLSIGEIMPTTSRTMNFRVTARDNRAGGGGVNTSDMQVNVVAGAGPFLVTSHNTGGTFSNTTTVTWNVAGTTGAPISAANVNILLSTNGGLTFPFVLIANTPNDGTEIVLLPAVSSTTARIKVEAAGNIFFDVNNTNFTVVPGLPTPAITLDSATLALESCATTNNSIDPSETVVVNFVLRNIGSAATTNLVATLLATNGVTLPGSAQSYGALTAGGPAVSRAFSFTASGSCGGTIAARLRLQDGPNDLGTVSQPFTLGTLIPGNTAGTNSTSIAIPNNGTKGAASLFPSSISVAGVTGTVIKATVTLQGFAHTYPQDADVLLVGPQGQTVLLLSDAAGAASVSGLTFTFDDDAAAAIGEATTPSSGTFKPSNYGTGDTFSSPAPAGTYGATLSVFNGTNPNGTWSLYIQDDGSQDTGSLAQGWRLNLTTAAPSCCTGTAPLADVSVGTSASPTVANLGSNIVITVNVTNLGPDTASDVVVTDTLPNGLNFISASSTFGTPTNNLGVVTCSLGAMTNGARATLTIQTTAASVGPKTNLVTVSTATVDSNSGNNSASFTTSVNAAPTIAIIGNQSGLEDTPVESLAVLIGDAETAAGSLVLTRTCSNTNLFPLANIVLGGAGTNRTITLSPATNLSGNATITLTVTDGLAATSTAFDVAIDPVNDAPNLETIANFTVTEGATVVFTNQAADVETPPQTLTFSLLSGPTNAALNPITGIFQWITAESDGPSTNTFLLKVADDGSPSLSATQSFTVVVLESNSAPVLPSISDRTVHAGTQVQITNTATDVDWPVNLLTFSLVTAPPTATIDGASGLLTWATTDADADTTNQFAIRVTDDGAPNLSSTNQYQVRVVARPIIQTIVITNDTATLTWSAIAGAGYQLQVTTDLSATNWSDVLPPVTATNATATSSSPVTGTTQSFFRVRALP